MEMIWWTGLAPWEFAFAFPGSLMSTFLGPPLEDVRFALEERRIRLCQPRHGPNPRPDLSIPAGLVALPWLPRCRCRRRCRWRLSTCMRSPSLTTCIRGPRLLSTRSSLPWRRRLLRMRRRRGGGVRGRQRSWRLFTHRYEDWHFIAEQLAPAQLHIQKDVLPYALC